MKSGGLADVSRRETCREKYGSDYYITNHDVASRSGTLAHNPTIEKKRWKKIRDAWADTSVTLTRGLTLTRSKGEISFVEALELELREKLEIQKHCNGRWIDAYSAVHDVWIQYDGIYWHKKHFARDAEQDEWFRANGKKLLRITDKEAKEADAVKKFADRVRAVTPLLCQR